MSKKKQYFKMRIRAHLLEELNAHQMGVLIRAAAGKPPEEKDLQAVRELQKQGIIGEGYLEAFGFRSESEGANNSSIVVDPSQAQDHYSPAVAEGDSSHPSDESSLLSKEVFNSASGRARTRIQYKESSEGLDPSIYPDARTPKLQGHALRRSPGKKLRPAHSIRDLKIAHRPRVKRFSLGRPDTFSVRWMVLCDELQWIHHWGCVDTVISHLQRRILERVHYDGGDQKRVFGSAWYKEQEVEARRMVDDHFDKQPNYWREVIDWFFDDPFWCDKILTTKALRRNYPRFVLGTSSRTRLKTRVQKLKIIGND